MKDESGLLMFLILIGMVIVGIIVIFFKVIGGW